MSGRKWRPEGRGALFLRDCAAYSERNEESLYNCDFNQSKWVFARNLYLILHLKSIPG